MENKWLVPYNFIFRSSYNTVKNTWFISVKKIFDFDYINVRNTFYWYTNTRTIISLDSSAILLILNPYEHDENNTLLQNLESLLKQVYTETFRILIMNIVELQNLQIWKLFCVGNFNANFRIIRWWAIKVYTINYFIKDSNILHWELT